MRLKDTTDPKALGQVLALLEDDGPSRALKIVDSLQVHLVGMYIADVGPEWDSAGKCQCDYLHHIDIPLTGLRHVIHGDHCLELAPGHAYYLPGNMPVERRYEERGQVIYLTFRCEWLPGVDPLLAWAERAPVAIEPCVPMAWRAWLESEWGTNSNHLLQLRAQVEIWLSKVVPSLNRVIDHHLSTHGQFEAVFRLIEQHLGADLRVTDLAAAHGTSTHAFSRAFSESTGTTPKEYLNRRLGQAAVQLVIGTDLTIKEIAVRLRFADEFYFSRFFKKFNGVSPTAYRQRFRRS